MNWLIAYGVGAALFAFVVVILSVAIEDPADSARTMRQLPWWVLFWPTTATIMIAAFIGLSLKEARR